MPGPRGCMVICEGCALRYCCRCHLSAVDNPWGEGLYGLNEREDEAINEKHVMENVKASQALKQKCTNENVEVVDLDELLNHLNAINAIVTRNDAAEAIEHHPAKRRAARVPTAAEHRDLIYQGVVEGAGRSNYQFVTRS